MSKKRKESTPAGTGETVSGVIVSGKPLDVDRIVEQILTKPDEIICYFNDGSSIVYRRVV